MAVLPAAPCDVLAVGGKGGSWANKLIRVGGILTGQTGVANHVIIVTHQDEKGRWIGVEGRPGGVGLVDCTKWLADKYTRSNHAQPRPNGKRQTACLAACADAIGVRYDWTGIGADALESLGAAGMRAAAGLSDAVNKLYLDPPEDGQLPGAVVCSSLAAMLYDLPQVGWAHPELGNERRCSPADWWDWNDGEEWTKG